MVIAGLRGMPHAGDMLRVVASEARARAMSEARTARSHARHHERMEQLAADHFETVTDEATGESKQCAPTER